MTNRGTVGLKDRARALELPAGVDLTGESGRSPAGRARIRYNDVAKQLEASINGGTYEALTAGGGGGGGAVANIAALSALDDTTYDDGVNVAVASVRDMFELDKSSTLAIDGITVAATLSGTGRWVRRELASLVWANQSSFFIDSVAGDDENDGATAGTALETWAEYARRVGDLEVPVYQVITFTEDANEGTYRLRGRHTVGITIQGETTVDYTGTFTTVTAVDSTTTPVTEGRVSDGAVGTFAPHVGKAILVTSGAAAGAYAWVLQEDPGGAGTDVARITEFFNPFTFGRPVPAPGDSYQILSFVTVTGKWSVSTTDLVGGGGFCEWFLIELRDSAQPLNINASTCFLTTAKLSQSSSVANDLYTNRFDLIGALLHTARLPLSGGLCFSYSAGLLDAQVQLSNGAQLSAQGNTVAQVVVGGTNPSRNVFEVRGGSVITTSSGAFTRGAGFGVYDLQANFGAFVAFSQGQIIAPAAASRFWTKDQIAASFGVRLDSYAAAFWPQATLSAASYDLDVGGAGSEFQVGGVTTDVATLLGPGTITAANNAAAVPLAI